MNMRTARFVQHSADPGADLDGEKIAICRVV
jgi:hypothetical protein